MADDADLRLSPPRAKSSVVGRLSPPAAAPAHDRRLPPVGSVLARKYRGEVLQVRIRADGFELEGTVYPSLSAVAKAITGGHCNGFYFFRLPRKEGGR